MYYALCGGGGVVAGLIVFWLVSRLRGVAVSAEAERMKSDAEKEAEHIKREAKVAAKSEILKMRDELEGEMEERRRELVKQEKRLNQRESNIEQKADALESRMRGMEKRENEVDSLRERLSNREMELKQAINRQIDELERIADLDRESAKNILLEKLDGEVRHESGIMVRNILEEMKEKSEREAQKIMTYAMQRYSSNCTYDRTSATIPLPNDEMKGRIIGREGRNIQAIEAATGVSILIDDTPEAVVISCFDPVRKETARILLERLIDDGRIHPARIEELTKKVSKQLDEEIFAAGEAAVLETNLQGIPAAVVKLLGRLKFRYSFSQNVLKHSLETAYFMGILAAELGLDEKKAKRIGLLHDIGKAVDHEIEGTHAAIGADLLRKHGEAKDVINAVAAHHEEVEPNSLYAILVSACDALSASRPGARSETTELYLKRLEQLEDVAMQFPGVESCFALQAGREIRVVVNPEKISDGEAQMLARDICQKIEREMNYPGQIRAVVIRETRTIDYAK